MLNLAVFEKADEQLLESSFDAIQQKDNVTILNSGAEHDSILRQTIDDVRIPLKAQFSFQNLFKVKTNYGCFYIAQCLVDFGYPAGSRSGVQSYNHVYEYQLMGIAHLRVDLGITNMRKETAIDKLFNRFFYHDINFTGADRFNEKYLLVSDSRPVLETCFDNHFLSTIAEYDDVLLSINHQQLYISFDQPMNIRQTSIVQDILSNCKFLGNTAMTNLPGGGG